MNNNRLKKLFMQLQQLVESDEAAYNEVLRGRAWASMIFRSNYSDSLIERTEAGRYAEEWTIEASDVAIQMDMSSMFKKKIKTIKMIHRSRTTST